MDNIDFEVLSRLQELYKRFDLKPYEVVAELRHDIEEPIVGMGVKFDIMWDAGYGEDRLLEVREARAKAMFKALGLDESLTLGGGEKAVIDALDSALQKAPKPRIART